MPSIVALLLLVCCAGSFLVVAVDGAIPNPMEWPSDGLVGHWDFSSGSASDKTGNWGNMSLFPSNAMGSAALRLRGSGDTATHYATASGYSGQAIISRTIVSRFKMADINAATEGSLGSIATSAKTKYDGIIWEDYRARNFFIGSDGGSRTDNSGSDRFDWNFSGVEMTIAIVLKQEGSNTVCRMYIDGFLRRSYTKSSTQNYDGAGVEFLWGIQDADEGAVEADVYESRLYNRALRESEIVQIVPVQESTTGKYLRAEYIAGYPGFDNARRMCRGNGFFFARFTSASENEEGNAIRTGRDLVIGGSDRVNEGVWVWEDGPGAGDAFFTRPGTVCNQGWCNWISGEPNGGSADQDYMQIKQASPYRWNDFGGGDGQDYVWLCQREQPESVRGKYMAFSLRRRVTLDYGLALCAAHGGWLATVSTEEEATLLNMALLPSRFYLVAGSDEEVEGEWRWMAGKLKGQLISNGATCRQQWCGWRSVEPNDVFNEDDLVVIKGPSQVEWVDSRGTKELQFGIACELPPTQTLSTSQTPSSTFSNSESRSTSRSISLSQSRSITRTPSLSRTVSNTPTRTSSRSSTLTRTPSGSTSMTTSESTSLLVTGTVTMSTSQSISTSLPTTSTVTASASRTQVATVTFSPSVSLSMASTSTLSDSATRSSSTSVDFFFSALVGGTVIDAATITKGASQRLRLTIVGESFDMRGAQSAALNSSAPNPEVPVFWCEDQPVGGPGATGCFGCIAYQGSNATEESASSVENSTDAMARVFRLHTTLQISNFQSAALLVGGAPWLGYVANDLYFTIAINPGCFPRRRPFPVLNFTLRANPPPRDGVPQDVIDGSKDAATAAVITSGIGSPAIAGQLSRSSIALDLSECEPDRDEMLDFSQHPLGAKLGDSDVAYYVGGALLNPVVCLLFGAVLVGLGGALAVAKGKPITEGFEFSRFPSLLSFPLMFLIEPTAMCAVTTLIYGSSGFQVTAGISLIVCILVPVLLLWYLRHHREHFVFHPVWSDDDDPNKNRGKLEIFFFGTCKWTDVGGPHATGFCQRNRLLFCDYRGEYYWFLCVEMTMSVLCGSLDGAKLGFGRCNGIIIALIITFALFLVILLAVRPYNAPFLQWFAVALTSLQLCSSVCIALFVFQGVEAAEEYGQWFSLICMWLLMLRMPYDIGPKGYRWYKGLLKLFLGLGRKPAVDTVEAEPVLGPPNLNVNFNNDLHRQLLDRLVGETDSAVSLDDVLGIGPPEDDIILPGDDGWEESFDDLLAPPPDEPFDICAEASSESETTHCTEAKADDDDDDDFGDDDLDLYMVVSNVDSPLGGHVGLLSQQVDFDTLDVEDHPDIDRMREAREKRERNAAKSSLGLLAAVRDSCAGTPRGAQLSEVLVHLAGQDQLDSDEGSGEVMDHLTDAMMNSLEALLHGVHSLEVAVLRKRLMECQQRKRAKTATAMFALFSQLSESTKRINPDSTLARLLGAAVVRAELAQELEEDVDIASNPIELAPRDDLKALHALLVENSSPDALELANAISTQLQSGEEEVSRGPVNRRRIGHLSIDLDLDDVDAP